MANTFVAIDFETASRHHGDACAVGVVRVQDGEVVDAFESLIRPQARRASGEEIAIEQIFDDFCVGLHGIGPDQVREAPTFAELWPELSAFIGKDVLVAHNASFDMKVLRRELWRSGLPIARRRYGCTYRLSERMLELPNYQLPSVAEGLGISFERSKHHGAAFDAHIAGSIMAALISQGRYEDVASAMVDQGLRTGLLSEKSVGSVFVPESSPFRNIHDFDVAPNPDADPTHPLYGRLVVFSGKLRTMERDEAWARVAAVGGIAKDHPSKKDDFLVLGTLGGGRIGPEDTQTHKFKKVVEFRAKGATTIVLDEEEFLNLLEEERS